MEVYNSYIVFQEFPDEVSLVFTLMGCGGPCKGCHSSHLHRSNPEYEMDTNEYYERLHYYLGRITCVGFFAHSKTNYKELETWIDLALKHRLKVGIYTNADLAAIPEKIQNKLTYLKVGAFDIALGGLDSPTTNQIMYKKTHDNAWEDITYKFKLEYKKRPL